MEAFIAAVQQGDPLAVAIVAGLGLVVLSTAIGIYIERKREHPRNIFHKRASNT